MTTKTTGRVALVTGGSTGLGLALSGELARQGWQVITDGRSEEKFKGAALPEAVTVVVGDLTDAEHRDRLRAEVEGHGRLDLLVHNASTLGPLPMRPLAEVDIPDLMHVWRTNIGGPLVLTSTLLPWLREADGVLLSISSDAAVHHYETWGLYGASKAALDHVTLTYAPRPACGRTPSTPATCGRRCTRTPSRARTSRTGRCRRPSYRASSRCWTRGRSRGGTSLPTSEVSSDDAPARDAPHPLRRVVLRAPPGRGPRPRS